MTTDYARVRHLIGATSEWAANPNLVLGDGEIGIEKTAEGKKIKIGDGLRVFSDLPYLESGSVRSVGLSAPAGFIVDDSPVTSSGVLGLSYAPGYSLPPNSKQATWDAAAQQGPEWDGGSNGLDQAVALQSLGLDPSSSPTFHGLTVTGTDPVSIPHIDGDLSGSLLQHVQNDDTVALTKGTPVYVTGSVGNTKTLKVRAAKAGDPTKMPALGLIASDVQPNGTGHVTNGGEILSVNTSAFTSGTEIFVGELGGLSQQAPASGEVQVVGCAGRIHASTGTLSVSIGPALSRVALANFGTTPGTVAAGDAIAASQLAVKTYADGKFLQELSATASQPIGVFDTSTADAQGVQVRSKRIELSLNIPSGLVKLDAGGLVPAALLPGFVDDVLEFAAIANFPVTGETGKIYISLATNKQYRWSGSQYTEISPSPGSTDSLSEGSVNLYYTTARVNTWFAGIIASAGTPANLGPVAAVGTSPNPARLDHVHRFQPTDIVIPLTRDRQTLWVDTVLTYTKWPRDCILETIPLWSVTTAATGATIQLDIRVAGTSIFATLPTIDAGELGSDTAAVPATFSAAFTTAGFRINRLSVVTFHVLQAGVSPNQGAGLKVAIPARRATA